MKCLMRMFAKENKGVIFFETCVSFRQQRHTYIECIPVPAEQFEDLPAYFKVCPNHLHCTHLSSFCLVADVFLSFCP